MKSILKYVGLASLIAVAGALTGCASVTMPPPTASASTVEKLRGVNLMPASVGKFGPAANARPSIDSSLDGLRGSSVRAASGSYSQHLKDVVIAGLKAAGLFDDASIFVIEAQLTESQVDAAIRIGTAKLAANFTIDKAGHRVFEKTLSVDSQWESSFVGAIAIPEAINQYTALYRALATKLFDDPEFRAALAR